MDLSSFSFNSKEVNGVSKITRFSSFDSWFTNDESRCEREMNLGYRLTPGIYPSDASLSLPILCPWIRDPDHVGEPLHERRMMEREKKERKSPWNLECFF